MTDEREAIYDDEAPRSINTLSLKKQKRTGERKIEEEREKGRGRRRRRRRRRGKGRETEKERTRQRGNAATSYRFKTVRYVCGTKGSTGEKKEGGRRGRELSGQRGSHLVSQQIHGCRLQSDNRLRNLMR